MDNSQELLHYGMPRRSGRYPWGSGKNPNQHSGDFLSRISELKSKGLSETEIAKAMGLTTTQYRAQKALAKDARRALNVETAKGLREKGYSLNEIAEKMGFKNDSSVRSLLNENSEARMNQAKQTAEFLKKQIKEKGMLDVGTGVERELGISKEKLKQALSILEDEEYEVYGIGIPQVTNRGQQTNVKVLCPPGTEHKDVYNFEDIHSVMDYTSHDGGVTFDKYTYPKSMDSNRIKIRYAEEGGIDKDGLVEIRRGVPDLDMGESKYAQVRILVDDTKYIKGMAVYSDNMPDGVDIVFNTNKKQGTPKEKVLKDTTENLKKNPDNPFGALIKANGQSYYTDENGNKQLSLINKTREEGDWNDWAKKLPSQFLSKQNLSLVNRQLKITEQDRVAEFEEICSLTNPTVKKKLLRSFADDCDAAAVHLKAAALPRQKYQVILPIPTLKDNEVYAPNYEDGETVALVRFPHGGTFEIPILKVNNKQKDAKALLGNAKDAVGINKNNADRLSGADFDGDTVMVVPCNSPNSKIKITSKSPLKGLEGFDTKDAYGPDTYAGKKVKIMKNTQTEMGMISNLITDMTLKGASDDELAKAVRHSMVVIDAEKHKLNYKQSEIDNDIASLKKRYQGRTDENGTYHEGASTLLSRAKSEVSVVKRKGSAMIDPETGKQSWKEVDDQYYVDKKTGKTKMRTQQSTQMAETDDARTLSSGHPVEERYADYANKMKSLANEARKEMIATPNLKYSREAKEAYQEEVRSLNAQLNVALKNAPRERQAQAMANAIVNAKKQENPDMTKAEIKKISQQALTQSRANVGAKRELIKISDKEWEAIQAGAISDGKLQQILDNTDIDEVRQRATPRQMNTLSDAKVQKIQTMVDSGYTTSEIAKSVGVSSSTVLKYLD